MALKSMHYSPNKPYRAKKCHHQEDGFPDVFAEDKVLKRRCGEYDNERREDTGWGDPFAPLLHDVEVVSKTQPRSVFRRNNNSLLRVEVHASNLEHMAC